jgi:hypothetical protein
MTATAHRRRSRPAGLDRSVGVISSTYGKDPSDPAWDADPGVQEWRAFMKKYYPEGGLTDVNNVYGYSVARTLVQVLKQCGDNLTRENVMKQAASLTNFETGMGLPGITISTGPTDFAPIKSMQLIKFDGKGWVRFGDVLSK